MWGLSPRREHLSKGLKPVKEWDVCRWKRSVFQGNQREGKCSMTEGVWGFQRTARGAMWSSTWEEKGGMRFIFTNIPVLHMSCLCLQEKSLTFKDSPEPPLLYETVRAPRLLSGASGLSTALWWGLLSVLPAENELLKERFCSLSLVIKMSSKYWMNLQMNPRRNDANIFFHLHLGPLETGYSRNPGLLLKRI